MGNMAEDFGNSVSDFCGEVSSFFDSLWL
jgi:hypothetical protein